MFASNGASPGEPRLSFSDCSDCACTGTSSTLLCWAGSHRQGRCRPKHPVYAGFAMLLDALRGQLCLNTSLTHGRGRRSGGAV
eukprot:5448550-Amphidinium_carterae.1